MALSLVLDTETTGFVDHRKPSDDPAQPHLVELGAILVDPEAKKIRAQLSMIVRPTWEGEIPEGASKTHGITTAIAVKCGTPLAVAIQALVPLIEAADTVLAYNWPGFDRRILRTAWLRNGGSREGFDRLFIGRQEYCVMQACVDLVNLAPSDKMMAAGFRHAKTPRLAESYRFFFNEEFRGAHGALADAKAAWRIWREIVRRQDGGVIDGPAEPRQIQAAQP